LPNEPEKDSKNQYMQGLYNISSLSTTDLMGMGNIRVMFAQTGKVLQDQSYYPFGMTMGSSLTFQVEDQLPDNKYKYNGNPGGDRGQDDFGLNWYDYGARMYDPIIGRWNGIDALAEY
jgi:RHS repeat-associated protein